LFERIWKKESSGGRKMICTKGVTEVSIVSSKKKRKKKGGEGENQTNDLPKKTGRTKTIRITGELRRKRGKNHEANYSAEGKRGGDFYNH